MRFSSTSTIAVLLFTIATGPAVAGASLCPEPTAAADNATHVDTGTHGIGIDISKAGDNRESQMVFFNQLSVEEKSDVCSHCTSSVKTGVAQLSSGELSFCQAILSVQ
jgi:hypothetical protein